MKIYFASLLILISVCTSRAQEKPLNVILLIGDGMGLAQMSTAYFYKENGAPNFSRFPVVGLSQTSSSKEKITDSAAGATAFATGKRTYNGAIGVDDEKDPVETLVERFEERGKMTGVIATSSITHATPASFYAHVESRRKEDEIARQLVSSEVDFFAGGGQRYFSEGVNSDLIKEANKQGITLNFDSLLAPEPLSTGRYGFLLADRGMPAMAEGRGDFLPRATEIAINFLDQEKEGFFLMVEGSQIDWGGHANNADYIIREVIDFDEAVGRALDFAEKDGNTLVIVTADHETGGFSLSSEKKRVPFQGLKNDYHSIAPTFSTDGHSATMVPVLAFGPGAELFSGIYLNTEIHRKIVQLTSGD